MQMPTVNGNKVQLQKEIGHFIQLDTAEHEGWSFPLLALQNAVAPWTIVYFGLIVLIGAWFLLNLTLAVIKSQFSEQNKKKLERKKLGPKKKKKKKNLKHDLEDDDALEDGANDGNKADDLEDLSPAQKRHRKEKARIERFIKKVDIIIRQKEIHDKLTPRGSQQNSVVEGVPIKL